MAFDPRSFRHELASRAARREAGGPVRGRGIVTCAGGCRMFVNVYVLIRVLRETLRCDLPIQLWHFGGEELTPFMRATLGAFDVELVDATAWLADHPASIRNGWQLKAYAVLYSRFAEVLFLDADQVPVRHPGFLFDSPEFRATGAIFWRDILDLRADNPVWQLVGLEGERMPSWESGQMVIDKPRHWAALHVALFLNEQAELTHDMLYGDKDTFLLAWRTLGAPVHVVPFAPLQDDGVLVQRDFSGEPLFQHRTGAKWRYAAEQVNCQGQAHAGDCLRFLAELRAIWNGRQFYPPDRSLAARAEEERLVSRRAARLDILGSHAVELAFLPGHEFGLGRGPDRQNWYVTETGGRLEIVITDGDEATYRLAAVAPGLWAGAGRAVDRCAVELRERPAGPGEAAPVPGTGLIGALVEASGGPAPGSAAAGQLAAALTLLLRAEPGLRAAALQLAETSAELGAIIRPIVDASDAARLQSAGRSTDVLSAAYQPSRGSAL